MRFKGWQVSVRRTSRAMAWLVLAASLVFAQVAWASLQPAELGEFDHKLWDAVLREHVNEKGRVDYAAVQKDEQFDRYLEQLEAVDVKQLKNADERLAFWINAYNALTIRAVLDTLPADQSKWAEYRIIDQKVNGTSIWKGRKFDIGGEQHTLDDIEHNVIRKRDGLRDPRIHVALVCAAKGCPYLWNRAFSGAEVREQLAAAMRRFAANDKQVKIEKSSKTITISKIFEWYGTDFANPKFFPHGKSIPIFLAEYVSDQSTVAALRRGKWTIGYFEYDWHLNIQE